MQKIIEQLTSLKDYCMANTRGKADDWYDDAEALKVAIKAVEKQAFFESEVGKINE